MNRKLLLALSVIMLAGVLAGCSAENITAEDLDNVKKIGAEVSGTVKDVVTDEEFQDAVKEVGSKVKDIATDEEVRNSVKGVIDAVGNASKNEEQ